MTRAPGKRTTDSAATKSAILGAIEGGATYAQAARDAGVTPARARQVAKEAGLPPRSPGGPRSEAVTVHTARGAAVLARVVADAVAGGVDPEVWLADAERACAIACPSRSPHGLRCSQEKGHVGNCCVHTTGKDSQFLEFWTRT